MTTLKYICLPVAFGLLAVTASHSAWAAPLAEGVHPVPAPLVDEAPSSASSETAILAGGQATLDTLVTGRDDLHVLAVDRSGALLATPGMAARVRLPDGDAVSA